MDEHKKIQIFFDPKNKRWPRIRNSFIVFIFMLFLLLIVFLISVYLTPGLNKLPLSTVNRFTSINYKTVDKVITPPKREFLLHKWQVVLKKISPRLVADKKNTNKPIIIGFLVNYDDASYASLVNNLNNMDVVIGDFLHVKSFQGDLVEDDPDKQRIATDYILKHKPQTKIMPLVSNIKNGKWQPDMIAEVLASKRKQNKIIQHLLDYVNEHHYSGINIDFEEIPLKSKENLTEFMKKLTDVFHSRHLTVSIDVVDGDAVYDLRELSKLVDYIVLMAYDEYWEDSEAGPIASIAWLASSLNGHMNDIPNAKLVIGLANYGYDWIRTKNHGIEKNFQDLMVTSDIANATIVFDSDSLNPRYSYLENKAILHDVWFLDAASLFNQLSISQSLNPYGYSLWRLGSEDPSIWKILGHRVGAKDIKNLQNIEPGYAINYQGKGEVINVAKNPQQGFRKIQYDAKRNLIIGEKYIGVPTSYILNRYGGTNAKKIALTFDDGPDPIYTKAILDILKQNNVHATFFVIGSNAMLYPNLLKRELLEGHDIGNHTFTHPNISDISSKQLLVEVAFTQRLLESYLGRGSHLFRPPYAEDTEPESASNVQSINGLSKLGYLIVGMNIDPNDWLQPGVDEIIENIMTGLSKKQGNIILLHDSGGNREQTVEALPKIISEIKARGYQFVTLSELLGVTQNDVMPLATKHIWESMIDNVTFNIMFLGSKVIKILFFICIIMGLFRVIILSILASYQKVKDKLNSHIPKLNYSVAVIVPAHNEEKVIIRTINRLLNIDCPLHYQIVVVDDGSTDNTLQLLKNNYQNHPLVKIISQENYGKAMALNNAIYHLDADIIVTIDADTLFTKNTINELICHFDDDEVGAVAGNIKVGNKINLLTKMQAIEYITSQNLERRAFKILNAITVIPGCVGAWRRKLVVEAGGFTNDTLAEDADLTLRVRRLGYHIVYADKAIAYTEAPDTIKSFLQQRYRWMFGTFQVAWKHLDALFRPRFGYLGFVALPGIFLYQIFYPLIAPLMDLLIILLLFSTITNRIYHPAVYSDASLMVLLTYYLIFTIIDFIAAYISFVLESNEKKKSLVLLIPQRFFYRQLIYYVAFKTVLASFRGRLVGWNKVIRKATVNE